MLKVKASAEVSAGAVAKADQQMTLSYADTNCMIVSFLWDKIYLGYVDRCRNNPIVLLCFIYSFFSGGGTV